MKGIKKSQGKRDNCETYSFRYSTRKYLLNQLCPEITELLCKAFRFLLDLWLTSSSHQIGLSQKTESQSNLKR